MLQNEGRRVGGLGIILRNLASSPKKRSRAHGQLSCSVRLRSPPREGAQPLGGQAWNFSIVFALPQFSHLSSGAFLELSQLGNQAYTYSNAVKIEQSCSEAKKGKCLKPYFLSWLWTDSRAFMTLKDVPRALVFRPTEHHTTPAPLEASPYTSHLRIRKGNLGTLRGNISGSGQ